MGEVAGMATVGEALSNTESFVHQSGVNWCMPTKTIRRSVTLPAEVAKQVGRIAKRRRLGDNRVLLELIEEGIESRKRKEAEFFELAERFRATGDPEEVQRLGDQLGSFVFGE